MKEVFSVKQKIEAGTLRSIDFDYLWLLFKPGDLIFTSSTQKRAYIVLHVTGGRAILDIGDQPSTNNRNAVQPIRSWEQHEDQTVTYAHSKNTPVIIDTFYIDFDGDNFGPVPRKFVIQEYEGEQEIVTLPAFPAIFDKDIQKSKEMLKERGKKFVKLAGVAHRKYAGLSAREPSVADWQEEVRHAKLQTNPFRSSINRHLLRLIAMSLSILLKQSNTFAKTMSIGPLALVQALSIRPLGLIAER